MVTRTPEMWTSVETFLSLQDTCLGNLKGGRVMFGRTAQLKLAASSRKDWKLNTRDTAVEITYLIFLSLLTSIVSVTGGCILCLFLWNKAAVEEKWLNQDRHISCFGSSPSNATLLSTKINILKSSQILQERGTTQNLIASSVWKLWLLCLSWGIQPARRRRRRGGG